MENNIRVAKNDIRICGVVKEIKNGKKFEKDGNKSIGATLVVKTGEFKEVEVKCFTGELTKKGTIKKNYEVLEKLIDGELKTLANADENNPAIMVDIYGSGDFTPHLEENSYVGSDGKLHTNPQITLGFGNIIVKDLNEEDFCATFDMELCIKNIKEEIKNEEETGRVIIECLLPLYGNTIMPVSLVAGKVDMDGVEFDMADAFRSEVEIGETLELYGDIVNIARIEKVKKESKFGIARTVEKREFVREYVITGADEVAEDKVYETDEIKEALANREIKLQAVVEKAENKEDAKPEKKVGFNKRRVNF